ncbi:MAG: histidinol dehydrogenase [Pirellulales bacterium]
MTELPRAMTAAEANIQRIDARADDAQAEIARLRAMLAPRGDVVSDAGRQRTMDVFGEPLTPSQVVRRICQDVRDKGIDAVLDYSARLDQAELTPETLRVPEDEIAQAHADADDEFLATVRRIRENVLAFQQAILHRDVEVPTSYGGTLRQRYVPLRRAGLCIPGGAAAYPSTLLMTAVPAQAAGVAELAVVAPPTQFGAYNTDLLATCHELGLREVYRMGGAQAVAALAYGVEGVPKVDIIVGPGNIFVALAKQLVYGEVDIDSIAGPSEVVVIADETADPAYIASDLIAQAEHAPGASILITWNADQIAAVHTAIEEQLTKLRRGDLARQSLEHFGALILVRDEQEAVELANQFASEHLHIATKDPERLLGQVRNAGAIFLGYHTPVAVGDYVAGPSHVLPTGGTARFASGLCANDFLRAGSVIHFTPTALANVADDVRRMAEREGLTAHAASVNVRLPDRSAGDTSGKDDD